jgi:hypothetical protein
MAWKVTEYVPNGERLFPEPHDGDRLVRLEGELNICPDLPSYLRYDYNERELSGKPLNIIAALSIAWPFGLQCWYRDDTSDTWYRWSSHDANTLMNDEEFFAAWTEAGGKVTALHQGGGIYE